jgi:hypothetical protein
MKYIEAMDSAEDILNDEQGVNSLVENPINDTK